MRASVTALLLGLLAACAAQVQGFVRSGSSGIDVTPRLFKRNIKQVSGKYFEAQYSTASVGGESNNGTTRKTVSVPTSGSGGVLGTIDIAGTLRGGALFGKSAGNANGTQDMGGRIFAPPASARASTTKQGQIGMAVKESHTISTRRFVKNLSLWWIFRAVYSVINVRMITAFDMPITVTAAHTVAGSIVALALCVFRALKVRDVFGAGLTALTTIAACQLVADVSVQICAQVDVDAIGPLMLCKAAEPLIVALLSALCLRQTFSLSAYASLLPIVIGFGLQPVVDLDPDTLQWRFFRVTVVSTIASALTTILSKRQFMMMSHHDDLDDIGSNRVKAKKKTISPSGMNAGLTVLSALFYVPLAGGFEMPHIDDLRLITSAEPEIVHSLVVNTVLGGTALYLQNEMWFRALQTLSPVVHTVACGTSVFFIDAALAIMFRNQLSPVLVIGALVASGGTALFNRASATDQRTALTAITTTKTTASTAPDSTRTEPPPSSMTSGEATTHSRSTPHSTDSGRGVGSAEGRMTGGGWAGWTRVASKSDGKVDGTEARDAKWGVAGRWRRKPFDR